MSTAGCSACCAACPLLLLDRELKDERIGHVYGFFLHSLSISFLLRFSSYLVQSLVQLCFYFLNQVRTYCGIGASPLRHVNVDTIWDVCVLLRMSSARTDGSRPLDFSRRMSLF